MDRHDFQIASNARFTRKEITFYNQSKVRRKLNREKVGRNKLSACLILAIVLMLITMGALATTATETLSSYFQSQSELYGNFEQWPMESKKYYSELKEELGLAVSGEMKYIVPGDGDLEQSQAEKIALDYVQSKASLTNDDLAKYMLQSVFYTVVGEESSRKWYVRFVREKNGAFYGQFGLDISSPAGEVLSYIVGDNGIFSSEPADGQSPLDFWKAEKGPMVTWSQEDLFKFNSLYNGGTYRLPAANELPVEAAIMLAQKTLKNALGGSGKPVEQYGIQAFIEKKRWKMSVDCWVVWLYDVDATDPLGDPLCYSVLIDSKEAVVLDLIIPGSNG